MDLVRSVIRFNLHPEDDLHASWLPREWPARHRQPGRFGEAGRAVLADLLRRRSGVAGAMEFNFDSPLRRIALLDGPSLRRLAAYVGLAAHKPHFGERGLLGVPELGRQLRRQARRLDEDAAEFVIERMPVLPALPMNAEPLQRRPQAAGRIVLDRGYRLLLATLAAEGETVTRRVQRKLPRRASMLALPVLQPAQCAQLSELMLLCIVPERLPQWDWLF